MRSLKTLTALALTLAIVLLIPLQPAYAAENGKYVSEVYVAYGKNADQARQTLRDKGFTPVEGNLNENGDTYVMMGYKTTNNIRDAITDLAMMNMNGDYSVENYKTLLKKQKSEIADSLNEFMAVIREYRVNLKAGKTKAVCAHDILNNYIDDDTGMKMGDLLNSETLQDRVGIAQSIEAANPDKLPDLVTILMQGNAQVIKSMEVVLSMAADTAENTWLDRFAALDYDEMLDALEDERPELNTEAKRVQYLDNQYGGFAQVLGVATQRLRNDLLDYEAAPIHIDTATAEEIQNTFGNIGTSDAAMLSEQEWLSIGTVYEGLKDYAGGNFAKGELLDFFLDENDPEDTETFIPMAAALSEGQRAGLLFVDLECILRYAFSDETQWAKTFETFKNSLGQIEDISVYQNIDRDLYKDDGSVALTAAAQRANNLAAGTTGDETSQTNSLTMITLISYFAVGIGVMLSGFFIYERIRTVKEAAFDSTVGAWIQQDLDRIANKQKLMEYANTLGKGRDPNPAGYGHLSELCAARSMIWLSRVVVIATIALAIASLVLTIIEYCRDQNMEQLPIPKYLVDNYTDADGGSFALNYKAVECNREAYFGKDYKVQKGACADLLADEGYQWLALYATKNSMAGKPLTPRFVVKNSIDTPSGYNSFLHIIGEKGALNLAGSAFKVYTKEDYMNLGALTDILVYVFYTRSNDVKTYDESAGNMRASAVSSNTSALFGFGGLAIGAILGVVGTLLVKRKKKTPAAA